MCSAGGSYLWPYSRVMWAVQSADSGGTRSQTGTPGYCPPAAGARVDCQMGCGGGGYGQAWALKWGLGGEFGQHTACAWIAAIRPNPTPRRSRPGKHLRPRRSLRPVGPAGRGLPPVSSGPAPDRPDAPYGRHRVASGLPPQPPPSGLTKGEIRPDHPPAMAGLRLDPLHRRPRRRPMRCRQQRR